MNEIPQSPSPQHNVTLSGDECRLLIHMITKPDATIPGPYAMIIGPLLHRLNEISNVQPPQGPGVDPRG